MDKIPLNQGEIKFIADYQRDWHKLIKPLRRNRYVVQNTSELSIHGDAPKCFLRIKEYEKNRINDRPGRWPRYIAKVGSKWYPIESITEHAITRIGQICKFNVAKSQLRIVSGQVRFLSRFFLRRGESLTHGIEVFQEDFGDQLVRDISAQKLEREFYTFAIVMRSIERAFPSESQAILEDFVKMLVFDALIGNNDRHPANWGIITSVKQKVRSKFSPIFDTARGLFWNMNEDGIANRLRNQSYLESYVNKSGPQIGWDGIERLNHFHLISLIYKNHPSFRRAIRDSVMGIAVDACGKMLVDEFDELLSPRRIALIEKCLVLRAKKLHQAIGLKESGET